MDGVGIVKNVTHQRVTALVKCNGAAFALGKNATLLFGTGNNAFKRLFNFVHTNNRFVATRAQKRSLIQKIGQVGTGKTGGKLGYIFQINRRRKRLISCVNLKDCFPTHNVGRANLHAAVKTTRTKQRRVENVGAVCCCNKDNGVVFFKTIHLNKQLVEGLLALIMTAANTRATLTSHGIDFVDKHDGRGSMFCLLKEVAHTRCTHAYKHFNKVGTRN